MVIHHLTVPIIFLDTGVCQNMMNTSMSTVSSEANLCSHLLKPGKWKNGPPCDDEKKHCKRCQWGHCVEMSAAFTCKLNQVCSGHIPGVWANPERQRRTQNTAEKQQMKVLVWGQNTVVSNNPWNCLKDQFFLIFWGETWYNSCHEQYGCKTASLHTFVHYKRFGTCKDLKPYF